MHTRFSLLLNCLWTVCWLFVLVLPGALYSSASFAIVPIDAKIEAVQGVSGGVGLAINGQAGNKDEQEYNIDSVLRYRDGSNLYVFIGDYNYSETNDERDEDELFLHGRWVSLNQFAESFDSELFVQYQYDEFADISSRELIGGNVRFRSAKSTDQSQRQTIFGAGLFYETEQSELTEIRDNTVRVNLYGKLLYEDEGAYPYSFSMTAYLQPAVNDFSDYRFLGIIALDYPIRPSLSVGFEVEVKHNSSPFIDVEKTDIEYGISLNYSF